ncbi:lipid A deacylase LpxR family protein [Phycisphaera mikurensis]|uniref:Lipid A deacylase LpxR family protein n=1 Tax=Phycisphaera mikurensis (strain NBRC 102666 / KCTC 22515 / FYK2301M01) TaxID=1142394 RepID=I0IJH6_PHYMF|nr:hypothetical protein PSMK_p00520 [Phycisphaera mikurensis NBRC 102666]
MLCLLALLLPAAGAAGADPALGSGGEDGSTRYRFQVLFDNDGAFVKPNELEDRHYTNGAALALSVQNDGIERFVRGLGLPVDGAAAGFIFAQEMYAPEDLWRVRPDPDDQPYAGYLYGRLFLQRERDGWLDHLQLDLGVVGPSSLAEQTQGFVHRNISGDEPFGWDSQLGDELAANLTLRRSVRLDVLGASGRGSVGSDRAGLGVELIPYGEVRVGTVHRDATLGGLVRIGWNLPDDFGPAHVRDPGSFTGRPPRRGWSVYGYAGAAARYVQWNTFLDGNYARDPSPSVTPEPLVGIFRGGFAVAHTGERLRLELTYGQQFFTHELKGQEDADGIGRLGLSLGWGF